MKSHSRINSRVVVATLCGIGIAAGVGVFRAQADQWDKMTVLTVNQPIQVRDTFLNPGTYVFKLYNSNSDRHVVQIFNADQSRIIDTVMAIPNYRMEPTGHSQFTFYETPPGTARAMRAWFYPGDNFGQEFPYPKHLKQLAMAETTSTTTPISSESSSTTTTETSKAEPAPTTVAEENKAQADTTAADTSQEKQAAEIAQSTPPPAPPAQAEASTERDRSGELPKTASPYPAVGLAGLVSLCLYGLLRVKRLA
jgi:hypothetical protein